MPLMIGQKLYGYCGGAFGRDHYNNCRVEAVGIDWIVVRTEDYEFPEFACGKGIHEELAEFTTPDFGGDE